MIYAFCNLHDVSWGTKGDNKVVDDKPAVVHQSATGEQVYEVEIHSEEEDIDAAWLLHIKTMASNRANPVVENNKRDGKTNEEDSPENSVNPYLTFLFWSVAVLSLVRFIGCVLYIIMWWGQKLAEAAGGTRRAPSSQH
ncbi:hypothetical protein BASA62_003632 [Batrachochytrium salamandrivorans]|nr:hypothetical protein BASA62_003632 [Batrachochytrium salamandrivorans]